MPFGLLSTQMPQASQYPSFLNNLPISHCTYLMIEQKTLSLSGQSSFSEGLLLTVQLHMYVHIRWQLRLSLNSRALLHSQTAALPLPSCRTLQLVRSAFKIFKWAETTIHPLHFSPLQLGIHFCTHTHVQIRISDKKMKCNMLSYTYLNKTSLH